MTQNNVWPGFQSQGHYVHTHIAAHHTVLRSGDPVKGDFAAPKASSCHIFSATPNKSEFCWHLIAKSTVFSGDGFWKVRNRGIFGT